jgi:hypothetical protein
MRLVVEPRGRAGWGPQPDELAQVDRAARAGERLKVGW